jgi:membrane associated rhomboid family serine protease
VSWFMSHPPTSDPLPNRPSSYGERLRDFGYFVLFLWAIEIADRVLFGNSLETHGIHPRSFSHLEGILFAPFLHAGWSHLLGNSISLMILGSAILAFGWRDLVAVSLAAAFVAGVLVWLIGQSNSNHIGASSLVFGYLGFLMASGFYQRTPATIFLSILVLIFYGGSLSGLFPTDTVRAESISWKGHLGGAIGGFLVARGRRSKLASLSPRTDR